MTTPELMQQRQKIQAGQFVGRHDQLPAAQMPHIVDGRERRVLHVEETFGMPQQYLSGVGEHTSAARSIEERMADLIFEPLNDLADRRLRPVEHLGGFRKAAFAHDRDECFEFEQIHRRPGLAPRPRAARAHETRGAR
jgi:hypothetical protein